MFHRIARRALSPRNAAATAVLTLALGGIAYAAIGSSGITNNSLTSADVKNNSLTGLDVKNGSLLGADLKANAVGGTQVNEGTLAKVPSAAMADKATAADSATTAANATNATNAADAAKLGGMASSAFVKSSDVYFVSAKLAAGQTKVLAENGNVSLTASCEQNVGGNDRLTIHAATTAAGAVIGTDGSGTGLDGGAAPTDFLNPDTAAGDRVFTTRAAATGVPSVDVEIDGQYVLGPDGSYIGSDGETTVLGVNYLGSVCLFAGYIHEAKVV